LRGIWALLGEELRLSAQRAAWTAAALSFFGMAGVAALKMLPDLLPEGAVLPVEMTATEAVRGYVRTLYQIGSLVSVMLGMDVVSGEVERGTLEPLLSAPVSVGSVFLVKLAARLAALSAGVAVSAAVTWCYAVSVFGPTDLARALLASAYALLPISSGALCAAGASALCRSQSSSALLGAAATLGLFAASRVAPWWLTPFGRAELAYEILSGGAAGLAEALGGTSLALLILLAADLAALLAAERMERWWG